ncbi:MAG: heparinase II/III family protein [Armatimonadetes bacterium]|nr:heparinase II/III family protein [Armatimonadota bacterium]
MIRTALAVIVCVGSVGAGAAGEDGLSAPALPDIVWPTEWTAFGSYTIQRMGVYGEPAATDLLPGEALKTIPKELLIGDQRFPGQPLRLEDGRVDLAQQMPPVSTRGGRTAYLMAPITATADTIVQIGAGANWWMQWWVDGRPVYGTIGKCGNGTVPITARDHVFDVALTKGQHVLAVAVIENNNSLFELAIAGPQELRAKPLSFEEAMAAGKRHYARPHWSTPLDFSGARASFQQALKIAATDEERAEALLAVAQNDLCDIQRLAAADAPAVRREFTAAGALAGALAGQKARAALGVGETWLLENNCARAREAFARARTLSDEPGWSPVVQFAVARLYLQERNNAAARKELTDLAARTDLDPTLKFDARLHLEALDVAERIRPDHPRLFFNANTWPVVKARLEADARGFQQLRQQVGELPEEFGIRDCGSDLMRAALVYRVTGDPALLGKIRKMLRATVNHYLARADFNAHVESRVGFLAALDWVWNDLPPAEREGLAHDMLRHAYGRHVEDMLPFGKGADRDSYYYMPMMHWYVGLTTLDPGMEPADYMRALAELGRGYDNHVLASFGGRLELMKDRGMVTRVEYAFIDLPTPTWTFLQCWQSAVGPIPDEWTLASGIAPSCVLRNVLGFRGGAQGEPGFRHFNYGHSWNHKGGWITGRLLYDNLGQFMHFFSKSQPEEAGIAAYLRQEMEAAGCVGEGHYVVSPYLLDLAGAPAPKVPDGLPVARFYPANGVAVMSSGFDPGSSTYALFACGGATAGQEELDAGHFTIYKKGYLALDSGTRAQWAGPRPASPGEYAFQSVAHNTVLIYMADEALPRQWRPPAINCGGQTKLPDRARVLAFETDPHFAYTATDATDTYHSDKCAQMVRQFVYLPPDHFVVFDRVVSKKAEYPKTWLLHTANEPTIVGKEFRADQENGRIFCRTLYPLDAVLEKVGGPGKEFWADGRNWPIPNSPGILRAMGMTDASDVPENVGRWRVEVKPGAARQEDCFLHLIQASDQTVVKMAESQVSDQGNQVEITFTVAARTFTVALNRTGEVGGRVRIAEGERVLVDRALTQETMPQSGLALDTSK